MIDYFQGMKFRHTNIRYLLISVYARGKNSLTYTQNILYEKRREKKGKTIILMFTSPCQPA